MTERRLQTLQEIIASSLVWAILFCIIIQVIFRYLIRKPLMWPEELSRYLLIWMVFMGAAILAKTGKHVRVEFFVQLIPKPIQQGINLLIDIVISISLLTVIYGAWIPLKEFVHLLSPSIQLPLILVFVVAPLSSLLMFIHYLKATMVDLRLLCGHGGKDDPHE